ncbi:helix-turn-helix domain-containing protein [Methylobacterium sp. NEAU 140]|uniref:helix-turn-helix domain-containing protein n=1 Tax=Methylobacterium sp. NEAU 140 TaxID=3064945 RepID=UPI0027371F52|nr:helix-turn-helix domain-containing protein [Methylobacterium sp. NEAU 140]MDP4021498.1 helix-turn-helix domain-containing protein [Methylobacterium sp. NEAU 140]
MDAIRLLASFGLGLNEGRRTFDRLFTSGGAAVTLIVAEGRDPVGDLAALGITARPLRRPEVRVAEVRRLLGLSQAEFATRFGLELDTVQNWEQGRNRPDPAAMVLLKVIEQNPAAVDAALAG